VRANCRLPTVDQFEDRPDDSTAGSAEGATINIGRLNLDSSGAFAVASRTAEASHTQFSTADYTLRTDERGEPIWIVTLLGRSSRPVGTIYIGATHGTVEKNRRNVRRRDNGRCRKRITTREKEPGSSVMLKETSNARFVGHRRKRAECLRE